MSFIEININNSFNKKENHEVGKSSIPNKFPILNQNFNKVNTETNSLSAVSVTNSASSELVNNWLKGIKPSIMRDVLVGATSATIGAIITYLILGIK
ncbi:MAG: hypothetical protein Q8N37_01960 [bacterium]|nr:hypothetical protein [bacterium]